MLDSLQKDLFVCEVCLNLARALLKDLSNDLCSQLVRGVCEHVCHLENNAVEELWVLQLQGVVWRQRLRVSVAVFAESRLTIASWSTNSSVKRGLL